MPETLHHRIIRHIELNGPLPLAEYMHLCMADRNTGYYHTRNALGEDGDFLTAPETSQMFGELIGIWCYKVWRALGQPDELNLVELGPGRGLLMKDILRTASTLPDFRKTLRVQMLETSERMIGLQREALSGETDCSWIKALESVSAAPTLILANEFLDVLPIRQYIKDDTVWREKCVGMDQDGKLNWVLGTGILAHEYLPAGHEQEPKGAVCEISPPRESAMIEAAELVARNRGAGLFIDYGFVKPGFGDTLQAVRNHQYADLLVEPGLADISSHVDFATLGEHITRFPVTRYKPLTQGEFLLALGLLERAGSLGNGEDKDVQASLTRQAERLALPEQMGDLFKVFAFSTLEHLWPFDIQA